MINIYKDKYVLLIDSSITIRNYLKSIIEKLGIKNIKLARNPNDAYKLIKDFSFDMILLDINYDNNHNGYDFIKKIKKEELIKKNTSIIIISSENSKKEFANIQDLNPSDYILKPFSFKDIKLRVERAFGRRNILDKVYEYMDNKNYEFALNEIEGLLIFNNKEKYLLKSLYGEILLEKGDFSGAYSYYESLNSELDWVLLGKLKAIYGLKNYKESRFIIEKIKKENPSILSEAAYINSQILYEKGNYEKSFTELKYSLNLTTKNNEKRIKLINLGNFLRKKNEVLKEYKKIMNLSRYIFENEIFLQFDLVRILLSLLEMEGFLSKRDNLILDGYVKKLDIYSNEIFQGFSISLFKERLNRIKNKSNDMSKIISILNNDIKDEIELNTLIDILELFKKEKELLFFDICLEKIKRKISNSNKKDKEMIMNIISNI